ncbi:MAG TPA: type VI secretion system baseplate subunit TssF [Blastocatellia bacterium]|nr:type VI secretion system baseplate subunit TssF [Blastocatellia bacterium]
MRDELLEYYERELVFLRQMGAEFARKYPRIAARLQLEPDKCEDPHVERLIEAFAFLAGRVHLKLDDEFPEITESLLNILYPHYLAPIPSMSIVQFSLDPAQGRQTAGYLIGQGTVLYSKPVRETRCRFRTCYPVTLWPIEVTAATLDSPVPLNARGQWSEATLRLSLRCLNNTKLTNLQLIAGERSGGISELRFYLNGEPQLVYPLYELLFNHTQRAELQPVASRTRTRSLSAPQPDPVEVALRPVGFEATEGLLPYTPRSFPGYRLLTEYFAFPEKFLFFDVTGIERAAQAGFGEQFELRIQLADVTPPSAPLEAGTFRLGCTPVINLFRKTAEPVALSQQQHEYALIPDVHRPHATEIYSIDEVTSTDPLLQQSRRFQPFYSIRHTEEREENQTFWYATRRPSLRRDDQGTEMYLSLVDLGFDPHVPAIETLTVHTTCTNRDLPGKMPFTGSEGEFQVEGTDSRVRVRCLKKPTVTLRPSLRRGAHWRLISHLSLNHLSIVEGADGSPDALREILLLYDFLDSAATRKQIAGITRVSSRRVTRQTGSRVGTGFVRGIETTIEFDEDQFVGTGVFLLASVLERFLGLYASLNSFNQLVARTRQREKELKKWPPRMGEQILL